MASTTTIFPVVIAGGRAVDALRSITVAQHLFGRIVNISSIGARVGASSVVAYGASKAGLEGFTRAYAARLAPEGVPVNAVASGLLDTEIGEPLIEADVPARNPIGRVGTGDEIAQAVMPLVGDTYITGQTLEVNGGTLFF